MTDLQELNVKMYEFARQWAAGADLNMSGVSLADCITYDVLSVLGRQLLIATEQTPTEASVL